MFFPQIFTLILLLRGFYISTAYQANPSDNLTPLEKKIILKLKVAAQVRLNLGKIIYRIPWNSHELYNSIKLLGNYLRDGGSLVDCLEDLPSLAFLPIDQQIAGIMNSIEENLPKYLIPATSFITRSITGTESTFNANDIYRPDFGALKADLFDKVKLKDLQEAGLPSSYSKPIYTSRGPWPDILSDVTAMISSKMIPARVSTIAYLLDNLRIPSGRPETRRSVATVIESLFKYGAFETFDIPSSLDPYELIYNVLKKLEADKEALEAVTILQPYFKTPTVDDCPRNSELKEFFNSIKINYTHLVERETEVKKSKAGSGFIALLKHGNIDIEAVTSEFYPFEYLSWRSLLLAFVSRLRRQNISETVETVYGDLIYKSNDKIWYLIRDYRFMNTVLNSIARKFTDKRLIRACSDLIPYIRLDMLSNENYMKKFRIMKGEDLNIAGPLDAYDKTVEPIITPGIDVSYVQALMKIIFDHNQDLDKQSVSNGKSLLNQYPQANEISQTSKKHGKIDAADLLQAIPSLDMYSNDYITLRDFISNEQQMNSLGLKINVETHPTRGRLLSWILQNLENAPNYPDDLQKVAHKFGDSVAYEGYGAGGILFQS